MSTKTILIYSLIGDIGVARRSKLQIPSLLQGSKILEFGDQNFVVDIFTF